ncbi:MAG: chromate transporter [Lawsonibacter sp.]
MILLRLFYEFVKVGLFSVGGGLATIPFLQSMGEATGWFTNAQLTTMIAVSESTPGPIGINMATYVGFETAGIPGAVVATLGEVFPSLVIVIIIAGFLQKFRQSKLVDAIFYGLRPASTALIASACLTVAAAVLLTVGGVESHMVTVHWPAVILSVVVFLCMRYTPMKKLHPIVFIGISALIGFLFRF